MFILSKLLGNNYQSRILEILIENYKDEFTIPEIIEIASTSRGSTYQYIRTLVKDNIINETRKIGNTQLYKLNKENSNVKYLILIEHNLLKKEIEKVVKIKEEFSIDRVEYSNEVIGMLIDINGKKSDVVYTDIEYPKISKQTQEKSKWESQ